MSPRLAFFHRTRLCLCQTYAMMPIELSVLDKAERGDSNGRLEEETSKEVDGREAHRTSEPKVQPQASAVQGQEEGLGE